MYLFRCLNSSPHSMVEKSRFFWRTCVKIVFLCNTRYIRRLILQITKFMHYHSYEMLFIVRRAVLLAVYCAAHKASSVLREALVLSDNLASCFLFRKLHDAAKVLLQYTVAAMILICLTAFNISNVSNSTLQLVSVPSNSWLLCTVSYKLIIGGKLKLRCFRKNYPNHKTRQNVATIQ